jgi:hypothetical protein
MFSKVKEKGKFDLEHGSIYMPPPPGKNIFKISKKNKQKIKHVHLDILCARAKFRGKPTFFVTCVKKMSCATPILAPKFVFLHTSQKCHFRMKQLCENI